MPTIRPVSSALNRNANAAYAWRLQANEVAQTIPHPNVVLFHLPTYTLKIGNAAVQQALRSLERVRRAPSE